MASITNRPNGHRWVSFRAPNGKRQTIRLGAASASQAEAFKVRVDRLLVASRLGEVPDPATVEWLSLLDAKLHGKLARCGLCTERGARTVAELVNRYIAGRQAKPSTLVNLRVVGDSLAHYFGRERGINAISNEQADAFRAWLSRAGGSKGDGLAPTTVSSMCRRARYIFGLAVKRRWLLDNPFGEQRGWIDTNPERDVYIPAADVERVLAEMRDRETRLVVAFARFAGLRCPSEPTELHWPAVDWEHSTLLVKAPKTERYAGHALRTVPLGEEVLAILADLWERAPEGATAICPKIQVSRAALADRLEAACRRAGFVMWPKPFVNLRASCEYDWLRIHPIDVVAAWMGHSPETMLRHYNRVVKEQSARNAAAQASEARLSASPTQIPKHKLRPPRTPANDCEPL